MIRVLLALLVASATASAHPAPSSEVAIELVDDGARAELLLPASELAHVTADLAHYLPAHISAETLGGAPWSIAFGEPRPKTLDGHPYWTVTLALTPPSGAPASELVLVDDAITHEIRNHYIIVRLGAEVAGVMQYPQHRITIGALPTSHRRFLIVALVLALALIVLSLRRVRASA
jgi:hypothetical protein